MKSERILSSTKDSAMPLSVSACSTPFSASSDVSDFPASEASSVDPHENYNTGNAKLDNPRNQDQIGSNELLVVSFGTSYNDNRRLTIGAIEDAIEAAFPDYSVRRGFTSQIIIEHVKKRDGEVIDNISEALDRAVANGVKTLVVQPTHLMNGLEYHDLVKELAEYTDAFERVAVGAPLLTSDEDFQAVMQVITEITAPYNNEQTAICFMGHGTEAESNQVYTKMQQVLTDAGHSNYFIGTVEASPSLEDILQAVGQGAYKRVVLLPLMIVAGDHANNDMAGDEEDSWKSVFEAAGYQVETVVEGLGQLERIQQLFIAHAQAAIDGFNNRENDTEMEQNPTRGTFYCVGVGPGDPELLTRKAIRILEECPVIAAPKTKSGEMLALQIAQSAVSLSGKEILPLSFTMERDPHRLHQSHLAAAEQVKSYLDAGQNVAMLNLGDVSIYSTCSYVMKILQDMGYNTVMIPGVPSFCAVAARLNTSLVERNDPLHIVPGSASSEESLSLPGTKVLMKSGRQLPAVLSLLQERGLQGMLVENCGLPNERVYHNVASAQVEIDAGYFSTLIVKES